MIDTGKLRTSVNDRLAFVILAVLFISPVPFGSNRPGIWAFWLVVLSITGCWYFRTFSSRAMVMRLPLKIFDVTGLIFLAYVLWLLFQILPLGLSAGPPTAASGLTMAHVGSISLAPGDTLLAICRWLTYGTLYFLVTQAGLRQSRSRIILRTAVGVVVLQAVYALIALTQLDDTILLFDKTAYQGAATGTFINRNSLATYLAIGVSLLTAMLLDSLKDERSGRQLQQRLYLGVAMAITLIALVATQSRLGLFAAACGMAASAMAGMRTGRNRLWFLGAIAGLLATVVVLFGSGLLERTIVIERSADGRLELYKAVFDAILRAPWVGYGASTFKAVFPSLHPADFVTPYVWEHAHNTYLALWFGSGFIFGSLPILLVGWLFIAMVRHIFSGAGIRTATIGAIGATVAVTIHALGDFSLEIEAVALLYITVLALGTVPLLAAANGIVSSGGTKRHAARPAARTVSPSVSPAIAQELAKDVEMANLPSGRRKKQ